MKKCLVIKISILMLIIICSSSLAEVRPRPALWATQIIGSPLKNWYRLDDHVYRSEQPSKKGFNGVNSFGISAVLNLRAHHSDERKLKDSRLIQYRMPLSADSIKYKDLVNAMRIIKQVKGKILIHCYHGSDRTGAICAAYRIMFHGWSKQDAIDEMINGGYGFHSVFKNIPELIGSIDVEKFKNDVNR